MTSTATHEQIRLVHPHGTFGPTVQGEGPSSGQRALFIRLLLCNLRCRTCDTSETWDASRYDLRAGSRWATIAELTEWVRGHASVGLVVITGGEPLIQQQTVTRLVRALSAAGRRVEIETNGTIAPAPELLAAVGQFNVSPKLSTFGAGMPPRWRIVPDALRVLARSGKAIFKFVAGRQDLDEIAELEREFGLSPIWIMPEGVTREAMLTGLEALAEPVLARGWNLTARLQVLIWGDERGR